MKYYVYELIDPRNSQIFYVGKGSGKRMYSHVSSVRHGKIPNRNKHLFNKIKQLLVAGILPYYKQIFFTDNNDEAFQIESERIKEIGIKNLCNVFDSVPTKEEIYRLRSKSMIGKKLSTETKLKISESLVGHLMSNETKQKISKSKKGKAKPCTERQRDAIIKAFMPKGGRKDLISPSGERVPVYCILDVAKKYGLNAPTITELYQGKYKQYKGWMVSLT